MCSKLMGTTDFTAAAIIDNFATESTQVAVERVMKRLATEKATEILKVGSIFLVLYESILTSNTADSGTKAPFGNLH